VQERGLVVSELPPGTGAWRWAFPARNRIMAALAGMTVVVEAAERSGSLITADLAADLGRDLGAVPGPVSSRASAGPNGLLAGGACLVRDAQDVLDAMLGPGVRRAERLGPLVEPPAADVLKAVERGEDTCEAISAALDLAGGEAAAALAALEAAGYVTCSLVGVYSRTLLRAPI
jgi:DNA processing protein